VIIRSVYWPISAKTKRYTYTCYYQYGYAVKLIKTFDRSSLSGTLYTIFQYIRGMRFCTFFFCLFSALIFNLNAFAGTVIPEPADTSSPVRAINPGSLIYSGPEYAKVYTSASGSPFFRDQAINGRVDYYQNRYENIPILYDIESDLVIFHEPVNKIRISLVNEKVSGFMIDGHHFIALKDATGFRGFYETLYQGQRQVLTKWLKILTRTGAEEGKYVTYSKNFIQEGNTLLQVSNKQELFRYFGKNKKKMQQYYQEQHLNFKKDPAHTIASLVAFAEQNGY